MATSGKDRQLQAMNERWAWHFAELYAPSPRLLVMGEGQADAPLALIGEAPGKEETLQGRPFVGKAGKNLDAILQATSLERGALYITNVVKFRPVRLSTKGTTANRTPSAEEVALFRPWLIEELQEVAPRVIVTLGNTPLRTLTAAKAPIGAVHGAPLECACGVLFPLYHPASLIYNRALWPVYEEDLRKLKFFLETAIPSWRNPS